MKTAEEYQVELSRLWIGYDVGDLDTNEYENEVTNLIKQAQKEAYNQALEDAAKSAECDWDGQEHIEKVWIDKESILKLKK